jgi:hypothetical protein
LPRLGGSKYSSNIIPTLLSITAGQVTESVLATLAFVPVTVCTGYLALWAADLDGFRRRSIAERLVWSVPASIGSSTIAVVLIGKLFSQAAVEAFLAFSSLCFAGVLCWELFHLRLRQDEKPFRLGPFGGRTALLAVLWGAFTFISLVDIQNHQRLFMSLTLFDHGARVNWGESILRTGIPPANPEYFLGRPASLRYYYFWLADCAAVARFARVSMRAAVVGGCAWSGFCIAALIGLYLKHFLQVGARLRRQFLVAIALLSVTGPYIAIDAWYILIANTAPPGLEAWPKGQITSWIDNFFFYPHHTVALACCMFAFLLGWRGSKPGWAQQAASIPIIGMCLASAFGLSIYVAFAFFLILLAWAVWQIAVERSSGPVVRLLLGGIFAAVLLIPYLRELSHSTSKMNGGHVFGFAVRETIPPAGVLALPLMRRIAASHSAVATAIANLALMIPGYAAELGFYFIVLLVFSVALWRGRSRLGPEHRALMVIVLAAFPFISLIRSEVLDVNDFGIHGGMFVEFPLLLLASELVMAWRDGNKLQPVHDSAMSLPDSPRWLISAAKLLAGLGALSTVYIALMLRFGILLLPEAPQHSLSHKAYFSALGYAHLDAVIPGDAVVQFNPSGSETFWKNVDLINIGHQTAIAGDQPWCGSELGGDPTGCPSMISAIVPIFLNADSSQARNICNEYGIQYLVANIYDPVWKDPKSWVWTLKPVVADPEFRAIDCR